MMYQPLAGPYDTGQDIRIDDQQLAKVSKFKYLGSTVMNSNKMNEEIKTGMSNVSISYGKLRSDIQNQMCRVWGILLSAQLFGAKALAVYKVSAHRINQYMIHQQWQILNVMWWRSLSNHHLFSQANLLTMYEVLMQRNVRWTGHAKRQDNNNLPKQILNSQLNGGFCGTGTPRVTFKNIIKQNLNGK